MSHLLEEEEKNKKRKNRSEEVEEEDDSQELQSLKRSTSTLPFSLGFIEPPPRRNIILGDYMYEVWYRAIFKSNKDRDLVRIRSVCINSNDETDEGDERHFMCYRSSSELGVWRLASGNPDAFRQGNIYDKFQFPVANTFPNGTRTMLANGIDYTLNPEDEFYYGDYVQTTVIFIPLQCFITDVFDSLEIYSDVPMDPGYPLIAEYEIQFENGLDDIITFKNGYYFVNELSQINDTKITPPPILFKLGNPVRTYRYTPRPVEILSMEREIHAYPEFETLNRRYNSIRKDFTDTEEFKKDTSKLMNIYRYICTQDFCNWSFVFEDSISFSGKVHKLELINKETNKKLFLYFIRGELAQCYTKVQLKYCPNISEVCSNNPDAFAPLTLIPEEGDVPNCYGLYKHYIPCGRLVGKVFDYDRNVMLPRKLQCSPTYTYSGLEYNTIFPYNRAKANELQPKCDTITVEQQTEQNAKEEAFEEENKEEEDIPTQPPEDEEYIPTQPPEESLPIFKEEKKTEGGKKFGGKRRKSKRTSYRKHKTQKRLRRSGNKRHRKTKRRKTTKTYKLHSIPASRL